MYTCVYARRDSAVYTRILYICIYIYISFSSFASRLFSLLLDNIHDSSSRENVARLERVPYFSLLFSSLLFLSFILFSFFELNYFKANSLSPRTRLSLFNLLPSFFLPSFGLFFPIDYFPSPSLGTHSQAHSRALSGTYTRIHTYTHTHTRTHTHIHALNTSRDHVRC